MLDLAAQYLSNQDLAALRAVNRTAYANTDHEFGNREEEESWRAWLQGIIDSVEQGSRNADTVLSAAGFEQIIEILEGYSPQAHRVSDSPQLRALNDEVVQLVLGMQQSAELPPVGNMLTPELRARAVALL